MKEKTKKMARFVLIRNESLLHKETLRCFPVNDKGVLSLIPKYIPVSSQGKLSKKLLKKIREELEGKRANWEKEISSIWDKELEILIIYKLASKYSSTDVDNLNKFMIDSMKGILFKNDNQVKLVAGRKDKIDVTYMRGQYIEKAIVRIDLFKNSKINNILNGIFKNDKFDEIPEED